MDTDTVISDITDNNSVDSQKQDELRAKTELNLNNLTNDPLKTNKNNFFLSNYVFLHIIKQLNRFNCFVCHICWVYPVIDMFFQCF